MKHGPVIVGIDGEAAARDAFALGQRLAELLDTSIDVVTTSGRAPASMIWMASAPSPASVTSHPLPRNQWL